MKAKERPENREKGLTLLEIIVTFIIAAFLGSMMVEYLGSSLTRGGEAVVMVQDEFLLNGVVEKITADYENDYLTGAFTFDIFKSNIENGNVSTNTPYYGDYTVQTEYIVFPSPGNNEVTDDGSGGYRLLKVTLNSGNQSLVTLFRK
jgi:type II secretory pathway pseudopilin PulG